MQAPESMEKMEEKNVEKDNHAPQQLDKLSYLVTSEEEASPTSNIIENSEEKKTVGEKDSNLVILEGLAVQTKKLERLTPDFQDRCVVCGLQGRMDWQITRHDDSWGLLCGSCGEKVEKRLRDSV